MAVSRFLCDGMLGHLARAMRVLGLDTVYAGSTATDDEVLARATREERALLTRDVRLAQRALKSGADALLLRDIPVDEQLILVTSHLGVRLDEARFFSRCTVCNGVLVPLPKGDVPESVPEAVRTRHDAFTRCPDCGKIYWPGTHVESMQDRLQKVMAALTAIDPESPAKPL